MVQTVKNLPAMQETKVRTLGQEDLSILAWRIPWTEEPGRLLSMGSQRIGHDCLTTLFTDSLRFIYAVLVYTFF